MKTFVKYESNIQLILILLLISTIIVAVISRTDFFGVVCIAGFFLIALVQYTFNITKYVSPEYVNTDARKVYMFLSTYVVSGCLICIIFIFFPDIGLKLENLSELLCLSWMILSPLLIVISLIISVSDFNLKKQNHENA
ncbi:hypothetical protein SD427_06945 [Chryseobacterium sp. JJR-5R]|uniref:hypothetical protein n=1 Tax=Chryseobacterium sp. JJR-5R TaxID=3093923 RepID=UPI002A757099|nr:hypothetical protein [Chryseobacterium sp. JJR-5R]WPO84062.1 hypothetical protein SD427_06945 [Chryseobacterium sp. JJR-5R]